MTIQTDQTPVSRQPSKILWQWRITLCDRDMLGGGDALQAAVRSVREDEADALDDEARAWLAVDWAVRQLAPVWLEAAGLADDADGLRSLPPVASPASASAAHGALEPIVAAARRTAGDELDALQQARQDSRSQMMQLEHAASAGDLVVLRQSCGRLVEMAAREGIPGGAGSPVAAFALLAARSAAQVVVWRSLARGGDIWDTIQPIVGTVQSSAVELYVQMGQVQHDHDTPPQAPQPTTTEKPTRVSAMP